MTKTPPKILKRCRYDPGCRRGEGCFFLHGVEDDGVCGYGKSCRYAEKCRRRHPPQKLPTFWVEKWAEEIKDQKRAEVLCGLIFSSHPSAISKAAFDFLGTAGVKRIPPRLTSLAVRAALEVLCTNNLKKPARRIDSNVTSSSSSSSSMGSALLSTPAKVQGEEKRKRKVKKKKKSPRKGVSKSSDLVAESWSEEGKAAWAKLSPEVREGLYDRAIECENDLEDFAVHLIEDWDGNWREFKINYPGKSGLD